MRLDKLAGTQKLSTSKGGGGLGPRPCLLVPNFFYLNSLLPPLLYVACRYRYTKQPLRNPQCNPYDSGSLIVDCEVERGRTERDIDILWVFQSSENLLSEILTSSNNKYTISERIVRPSVDSSQLRVDFLNDGDAGRYACQIQFPDNGTLAPAGQALQLDRAEVFRAQTNLPPCSMSIGQFEEEETCALEEFMSIGSGVLLFPGEAILPPGRPEPRTESNGGGGGGTFTLWIIVGAIGLFIVLLFLLVFFIVFLYNFICQGSRY